MSIGAALARTAIRRRNPMLYGALEKFEFARRALASASPNACFRRRHPDFAVPPLYLLWDAQSYTDYETYKRSGEASAALYWELIRRYFEDRDEGERRVCEWGCGPGRIIRHLPALSRGGPCRFAFYGTDYNRASIAWCQRAIRDVTFSTNALAPPLDFPDGYFDVLYCRSVLTHLSEEMHHAWIGELTRVVRPGGVFMLSTQGRAHRERLLAPERVRFDQGELVIRKLAGEGRLNFSAFHPPQFVRTRLLAGLRVLEHHEGEGTQDIWVVRNVRE